MSPGGLFYFISAKVASILIFHCSSSSPPAFCPHQFTGRISSSLLYTTFRKARLTNSYKSSTAVQQKKRLQNNKQAYKPNGQSTLKPKYKCVTERQQHQPLSTNLFYTTPLSPLTYISLSQTHAHTHQNTHVISIHVSLPLCPSCLTGFQSKRLEAWSHMGTEWGWMWWVQRDYKYCGRS